jgi:hypothetical protein
MLDAVLPGAVRPAVSVPVPVAPAGLQLLLQPADGLVAAVDIAVQMVFQ